MKYGGGVRPGRPRRPEVSKDLDEEVGRALLDPPLNTPPPLGLRVYNNRAA